MHPSLSAPPLTGDSTPVLTLQQLGRCVLLAVPLRGLANDTLLTFSRLFSYCDFLLVDTISALREFNSSPALERTFHSFRYFFQSAVLARRLELLSCDFAKPTLLP